MKAQSKGSCLLAAAVIAFAALPAVASAEYLVPPGNSAAIQYTETYPSAGGHKDAESGNGKRPPAKVLGSHNAKKLEQSGPDGAATARIAAETAPAAAPAEPASPTGEGEGDDTRKDDRQATQGGGSGNSPGGGGADGHNSRGGSAHAASGFGTSTSDAGGSSGLGEVLGHAAGTSSAGSAGVLLPLAILGAIAWSLVYLWRQRKRPAA